MLVPLRYTPLRFEVGKNTVKAGWPGAGFVPCAEMRKRGGG